MKTKTCVCCGKRKKIELFAKRADSPDGYRGVCLPCKREKDRAHYRTSETRRQNVRRYKNKSRQEISKYIYDYLHKHPCADCGEDDIVVLDFDHVRGKKRHNVSNLKSYSLPVVKKEIKKCEVRCANCHRRKTAKQYGWLYGKPRKHK